MSQLPKAYDELIGPLIEVARGILEQGDSLQPVAFVGNFRSRQIVPVLFDASDSQAKERSVFTIKQTALAVEADFVALVMEAWALPKEKMAQFEAIIEEYGSIGASPYRVDSLSITIETQHGVWVAQSPLKPKKGTKGGRTFSRPDFQLASDVEGRFVGLLSQRADRPAPGLH